MMSTRRILGRGLCGCLGILVCCGADPTPDPKSLATIQEECRQALLRQEQTFDHCSGEGLLVAFKKPPGKKLATNLRWVSFDLAGGRGRAISTDRRISKDPAGELAALATADLAAVMVEMQAGSENVYCYNSKYAFDLKRQATGYVVESLKPESASIRRSMNQSFGRIIHAPIFCHVQLASQLMGGKRFHLGRVDKQ